ncbi:MAG: peptide chain release factor 2 [Clostridia bacterium]|nr:peptide chain release factor 2 [Clostridia bacterium]
MIQLEEAKQKLASLKEQIVELSESMGVPAAREKAAKLEEETCAEGFWGRDDAQSVMSELNTAKQIADSYDTLCSDAQSLEQLIEMALEADDESFTEEILTELAKVEKEYDQQNIRALLSGEFDKLNAIVSIHPGAGGTEAQDWAEMLYRMYNRWAEKSGFKVKLVDYLEGDGAGIKSATFTVSGEFAYGYLKSEGGVHRLVRVSPFDASGRRQTSFASVEITPEFEDDGTIELREEDLEMETHRSSGAGGQHVNKTDSAVRIKHKPTGIVVGCQTERSQLQNRETCLRMLRSKLAEIKAREKLDKIEDIRGDKLNIEWGSQIRSYVFMPYTLAKDTRTGYEETNIIAVMDGEIDGFMNAYLKAKGEFLR